MGGKREKAEKIAGGLYRLGNSVVRIVGSLIFLFLVVCALIFTQYMPPGGAEIPLNKTDSVFLNLLALVLAFAAVWLLTFLEGRLDVNARRKARCISGAVMLLWIAAAGFWWINSSAHVPEGDQAYIYGGASYFLEGSYDFLRPGGYCDMYPYQLGLIALCELLFMAAGPLNYYAFEVICVLLAAGSAYCGCRIASEIMGDSLGAAGYNVLMLGCLPLIFYTPWVYGDIPSIFFAMLAGWMLLAYSRRGRTHCLVIMAFALMSAMLVRKNSAILLLAACIAGLLYALVHRDKKLVLALLASVVLSQGVYAAVYKVYEIRSGYEHSEGIPFAVWLATGVEETKGTCGWDNDYYKQVYFESGFDTEATAAVAKEVFRERIGVFAQDLVYCARFFGKKILSQWNGPLYQALFFNAESEEEPGGPPAGSLAAKLGDEYYEGVLAFCDRWQFIVYVGMLCYFLFGVKRDSNMLMHVLAIAVIGGFFYSIISEAKGRYIFPYYVFMFPFAVHGLREAVRLGTARAGHTATEDRGRPERSGTG